MRPRSALSLCELLARRSASRISAKPPSAILLNSLGNVSSRPGPDPVSVSSDFSAVPKAWETRRRFSTESGSESVDVNNEVDEINLKFAEAREEIELAMESKETVYFDEEAECARAAVKDVVETFESLLQRLPESQKTAVQRSMGLKIEQLKAELQQLND